MILLIDNYDSFAYNLYQLIGSIDEDIKVIRNDEMTVEEIDELQGNQVKRVLLKKLFKNVIRNILFWEFV